MLDHNIQELKKYNKKFDYIIYTALYGYEDNLHDPAIDFNENVLFVCFTDRKDIVSKKWKLIYHKSDLDPRLSAKYWKFFGYKYFSDLSNNVFWVDASLKIISSFSKLLKSIEKKSANKLILTFHNPSRNCVYDEFISLLIQGKENISNLISTWFFLKKNKYRCGNGLIAGGFIFRKINNERSKLLDGLMDDWWWCVKYYSARDQLTFNYLISKQKYKDVHTYIDISGSIFDCKYLKEVRVIAFSTKVNPKIKFNIRYKLFYLIYLLNNKFKKKLSKKSKNKK